MYQVNIIIRKKNTKMDIKQRALNIQKIEYNNKSNYLCIVKMN